MGLNCCFMLEMHHGSELNLQLQVGFCTELLLIGGVTIFISLWTSNLMHVMTYRYGGHFCFSRLV